jgi:hypothetical protein
MHRSCRRRGLPGYEICSTSDGSCIAVSVWALFSLTAPSTTIQGSVTANAPVERLEDDRTGTKPGGRAAMGFLQNVNTLPSLVIASSAVGNG